MIWERKLPSEWRCTIPPASHSACWSSGEESTSIRGPQGYQDRSANDPSTGSPMETLLRLLLPLSDKAHQISQRLARKKQCCVQIIYRSTQSVGATVCTKGRDIISSSWWLTLTRSSLLRMNNCNHRALPRCMWINSFTNTGKTRHSLHASV